MYKYQTMQMKTYNYNSIITFDELISHLNKFTKDFKDNVKYIEIQIKLSHSNGSELVVPTGLSVFNINIQSQMKSFTMILKKNTKLIQKYYKNDTFTKIHFHYKEIAYTKFINANDKKIIFLNTFTEKLDSSIY
uniref:Uncharacterized protein n=1 Tax=Schizopora paradoxa TaxID=27342 RepID=A0A5B9RB83_9AGAM|nr:hypothetical protein Schpa_000064 [Schizopora paradoxa]QEG57236.1 hypothetical protein Schpa_000064 [Schizopora paradoxa]